MAYGNTQGKKDKTVAYGSTQGKTDKTVAYGNTQGKIDKTVAYGKAQCEKQTKQWHTVKDNVMKESGIL